MKHWMVTVLVFWSGSATGTSSAAAGSVDIVCDGSMSAIMVGTGAVSVGSDRVLEITADLASAESIDFTIPVSIRQGEMVREDIDLAGLKRTSVTSETH